MMKLTEIYSLKELSLIKEILPNYSTDTELSESEQELFENSLFECVMNEFDTDYVLSEKGKKIEVLHDKFVEW